MTPLPALDSSFQGNTFAAVTKPVASASAAKARQQSVDFEAAFLGSMFQHMFAGANGEGPMGNTPGTGAWRSLLTDEYAKKVAQSGGVGLADHVYSSLIAQQEARGR